MTNTVTLDEAQNHLKELIHQMTPGDEIIITENERTVAKLIFGSSPVTKRPEPSLGKGSIVYMSSDFDEPLDEMKEYMQ